MIFLIAHFTENKGTTDYFRDFLIQKNIKHYYLRHPFFFTDIFSSELVFFDGKEESVFRSYKKSKNAVVDLLRNFFVTFIEVYKLRKKVNKVFSFGSFNTLPVVFLKPFLRNTAIVFWGVDYSSRRFSNIILNYLYLSSETFACHLSDAVFQPTIRQEKVRIKKHGLKKKKSRVIPNGIKKFNGINENLLKENIAFLYIGSITDQHGILNFIQYFYIEKKTSAILDLHIIGGGELQEELEVIIKKNKLSNKVHFHGFKSQKEIVSFIKNEKKRFFGIAPYSGISSDHVFYGDSLKIREYLSYGIPFIVPKFIFIDPQFKKFGFRYNIFEDVARFTEKDMRFFSFDIQELQEILSKYLWKNIFKEIDV